MQSKSERRGNMGSVPDLLFTAQIALASKGSARYTRAECLIAIGTVLLATWLLPGAAQAVSSQEAAFRTGPIEVADSPALGVEFKSGLLGDFSKRTSRTRLPPLGESECPTWVTVDCAPSALLPHASPPCSVTRLFGRSCG